MREIRFSDFRLYSRIYKRYIEIRYHPRIIPQLVFINNSFNKLKTASKYFNAMKYHSYIDHITMQSYCYSTNIYDCSSRKYCRFISSDRSKSLYRASTEYAVSHKSQKEFEQGERYQYHNLMTNPRD